MPCLQVDLEPVDPIQFGDNRSARAGEDHVRGDQDPSPTTLYGAIGAHLARRLGARSRQQWDLARPVLGEFCCDLEDPCGEHAELAGYAAVDPAGRLRFPMPAHGRLARSTSGKSTKWYLLSPLEPATPNEGLLSSLPFARPLQVAPSDAEGAGREEAEERAWTDEELLAELLTSSRERVGEQLGSSVVGQEALLAKDFRIGVGINSKTNTNKDGLLFSRPYRRYRFEVTAGGGRSAGYRAWYRVLDLAGHRPECWSGIGFLGGERARTRLTFAGDPAEPLNALRESVSKAVAGSQGFLAYLLTPCIAQDGPVQLEGREAVAAAIGKGRWVSGWKAFGKDQGPRSIRRLWPEGSVFFFKWSPGEDETERRAIVNRNWLAPLVPAHRIPGYGRLLTGVWT